MGNLYAGRAEVYRIISQSEVERFASLLQVSAKNGAGRSESDGESGRSQEKPPSAVFRARAGYGQAAGNDC